MKKILGNVNALTIIEILVAIVLTAIVMLHGTGFFIATWRLSAESKDYNAVLNDLASNLEQSVSIGRNDTIPNDGVFHDIDIDRVITQRTLRNNKMVTYHLAKRNMENSFGRSFQVISNATWQYEDEADNSNATNRICLLTAYVPNVNNTYSWR